MLRKCYHAIKECTDLQGNSVGNPDFPLLNLSSERPEARNYVIYEPGGNNIGDPDDPTGFWQVQGCKSLCSSEVSLEDAMLCAARQALECANEKNGTPIDWHYVPDDPTGGSNGGPGPNTGGNNPGGSTNPATPGGSDGGTPGDGTDDPGNDDETEDPTGGPDKVTYKNNPTECTVYCEGDGSAFTKLIPAGTFVGLTQALADAQAYRYACQRARLEKICLPELPTRYKKICMYEEIEFKLSVGGINPPYTIDISGLPSGLVAETNETGTAVTISGKPGSAGAGGFTMTATDKFGNKQSKDYLWDISGVGPAPQELPPCYTLCPYAYTFEALGVVEGTVEWIVINLPDGLHMSGGTISGNALTPGSYYIRVCWWDAAGHSCCNDYTLNVYDCASVPQQSFMLGLADQSATARLSSDLMPCDRVVYVQCLGFRAGLIGPAYAFLHVKIYDWDDSLMSSWTAGWISPFAAEMDQAITFPATPCEQKGARRIEVEYIFGCFSPTVSDCGMGATLQIWGY